MQHTAQNPIVNAAGKLPVGVSSFAKLVQGDYCFVDKTLLIKEILDSGDDVILITRPRRFGKTINMNMLHCFLQAPKGFAQLGTSPREALRAKAEKPAAGATPSRDLFDGLAINQQRTQYRQERGKRPVLFLSFRTVKESNWNDAYMRMAALLSDVAQEVSQEAPVDLLTHNQKDLLHKVIHKQAAPVECEPLLGILTKLLTLQHKGVAPWVLIDEYDAPMQSAYQHGYYKQMRNLMRGLLGDCLKDNQSSYDSSQTFVHKAVVTGILRVAKEDIFSHLNNPGTYGVLNHRFASFFGFTQPEVCELLARRDLTNRFDDVRAWYDGYSFGHETIYNPWSVINYLANPHDQAQLYWVNTSDNHLVHKLLSYADATVKQGLHELMSQATGHTTTQPVQEHVPLREVENDAKNLWGLLLATGYLTAVNTQESADNDKTVQLRIPNNEVRRVYNSLINRWLRGRAGGLGGMGLLEALVAGEVTQFAEEFPEFVAESVGYFDTGGKQPERFYHAFVLGMVQHLRDRYLIRSERESGAGRYDLALEPKDKALPGFVMEFKKGLQADGTLQQAADKALRQIQDKDYHADLWHRGVTQVIAMGLAFKEKQVTIAHTTLIKSNA
ncbi:MAG: AAA family ATPase [Myxococcota bacterium]